MQWHENSSGTIRNNKRAGIERLTTALCLLWGITSPCVDVASPMTHEQQHIGNVHTNADEYETRFCLQLSDVALKFTIQTKMSKYQYQSHGRNWIRFDRHSQTCLWPLCDNLFCVLAENKIQMLPMTYLSKRPQPLNYDFIEDCKCFLLTKAENNSCATALRPSVDKCQMVWQHEHKDMIENWLFMLLLLGYFK